MMTSLAMTLNVLTVLKAACNTLVKKQCEKNGKLATKSLTPASSAESFS